MQTLRRQSGMTMWGLLFVLGVLAFVLFLGFKLFPPYFDDFDIKTALSTLARQPDVGSMSKSDIGEAILKRLDLDGIDWLDLRKTMTIEQRGTMRVVRIRYEQVVPIAFNISALLDFDDSVEVPSGG